MTHPEPPRQAGVPACPDASWQSVAAGARPPLVESETLLRGHRTIEISHNGTLYRLQATRQGKLILTK